MLEPADDGVGAGSGDPDAAASADGDNLKADSSETPPAATDSVADDNDGFELIDSEDFEDMPAALGTQVRFFSFFSFFLGGRVGGVAMLLKGSMSWSNPKPDAGNPRPPPLSPRSFTAASQTPAGAAEAASAAAEAEAQAAAEAAARAKAKAALPAIPAPHREAPLSADEWTESFDSAGICTRSAWIKEVSIGATAPCLQCWSVLVGGGRSLSPGQVRHLLLTSPLSLHISLSGCSLEGCRRKSVCLSGRFYWVSFRGSRPPRSAGTFAQLRSALHHSCKGGGSWDEVDGNPWHSRGKRQGN